VGDSEVGGAVVGGRRLAEGRRLQRGRAFDGPVVGQATVGAIVSSTVIVWVPSAKLPQSSVTRYTRVILAGQLPASPLSLTSANVRAVSQVSLAVLPAARKAARLV